MFLSLDFKQLILQSIVRLSESSLMVNIHQYNSPKIKILYCIEKMFENNSRNCSQSNVFTQLSSGTIYNISVTIHRDSFQKIFSWKNQTVFKLVNTSKLYFRTQSISHFSD